MVCSFIKSCTHGVGDVLFTPYVKGNREIKKALYSSNYSLGEKAGHFIKGSLFCVPVINNIVYVVAKALYSLSYIPSQVGKLFAWRMRPTVDRKYPADLSRPAETPVPCMLQIFTNEEILTLHRTEDHDASNTREETGKALIGLQNIGLMTSYGTPSTLTDESYLACVKMLIMDQKGRVDKANPKAPDYNFIMKGFNMAQAAGLSRYISSIEPSISGRENQQRIANLRNAIIQKGPAIVCLEKKGRQFFVIVDHISALLNKIRLRDPYHGWEVTISDETFNKHLPYFPIDIQQFRPVGTSV